MNRRSFLGGAIGSATFAAAPAASSPLIDDGARPPADIEQDGAGGWRIRSWAWAEDAWRPQIAHARLVAGSFRIDGAIGPADRQLVDRWLEDRRS